MIRFDFMVKRKSFTGFRALFSQSNFKDNDKVILNYFFELKLV